MDEDSVDEGISMRLQKVIHQKNYTGGKLNLIFSQLSESSSGVFSADSSINVGSDSLTRALDELRLRDTEVEEEVDYVEEEVDSVESEEETVFPEAEVEPAIKRCQSLSTSSKQQRGAQRAKKVVRFADALGLELTNVRHFADVFESATELALRHHNHDYLWHELDPIPKPRFIFSPRFPQPETRSGFLASVMTQKVMLERAVMSQGGISGLIRVSNLHFEKRVAALITIDGWRSHREVLASFQPPDSTGCSDIRSSSESGMTDRFAFYAALPAEFGSTVCDRASLCIRYEVAQQTYWDNNFGENYSFDCLPISSQGWGDLSWASFQ